MKIHYHSDCLFFAGCEKMLVNFWLNDNLRKKYKISFSYRKSKQYEQGLYAHLDPDFLIIPLKLPPLNWPSNHFLPPFKIISKAIRFTYRFLLGRFVFFLYEVWTFFCLFKKIKPDIVHLNNGGYPAARTVLSAAIAARLAGCQSIIMVVNNLAVPYNTIDRWLDCLLDRWVVQSTTQFITGSVAASERLASVLQLDSSQIGSIHNGISLREIKETKEQVRKKLGLTSNYSGVVFGVVALMIERKGHKILFEAIEILKKHHQHLGDDLILFLEGNGDLEKTLRNIVDRKRLNDVIKFIGNQENVFDFMNAIDALILPSIDNEDFPNVTLEAMALGKAVIATELAGTQEQIVDGETGYLVPPKNSKKLADAIQSLLNDRELIYRMGKAGQKRFEGYFSAEIAVDRYLNLYQSLHK
ncbi:glycosyltransferase [Laspinema palackyanum]|uniref:glycosyltransferase n=1 Tax=Laspinema palackyanum TaxID=3231601 RepID=UPI00345CB9A7